MNVYIVQRKNPAEDYPKLLGIFSSDTLANTFVDNYHVQKTEYIITEVEVDRLTKNV